jgi:hypothetical protein
MAKIVWKKLIESTLRSLPRGARGYRWGGKYDFWSLYWWPEDDYRIRAQLAHEGQPYAFHETTLNVRDLSERQYKSAIFGWAKSQIYPPLQQLADVANENPTRRKEFTPSYPAPTQREYDAWVARCASEVGKPWKDRLGCKRLDHVMIEGGRTESRYQRGEVPAESAATAQRLGGPNRPFHARTQSVKVRKELRYRDELARRPGLVASGPALEIARAIDRFRKTQPQGALGFAVPTAAGPLIKAGMPPKAAHILVNRAARKFYPDVPYTSMVSVPLLSRFRQGLGPIVMESKKVVAGGPVYQMRVEDNFDLGYFAEISVREGGVPTRQARAEVLLDADEIARRYGAWREATTHYRRESGDPAFLDALFNTSLVPRILDVARAWGKPDVVIEVLFDPSGREVEVPFSAMQHSKSSSYEAVPSKVDYRSLQNVSLTDLPRLLARLSRRKKRKGRQLKPLSSARNNPSMNETSDNALLQLVFDKAYGPSPALIPVPGKPGRVYWPITKMLTRAGIKQRVPLGLKEVAEGQARSWLTIAETGRRVSSDLRATADSLYAEEGMSRRPLLTGPTSTPAAIPARENPMSKKSAWRRQYQQGPYGAGRSIPAARRNKGKRKLSPEARAKFQAVGRRAQQIAKASGCDMSSAMRQAWAEVKGMQAAANPWYPGTPSLYLPDNPVMNALVPAPYAWSDETEVFSALVPGPYRKNPKKKARKNKKHWKTKGHRPYSKFSQRLSPNYEQIIGQFSTQEQITHGMQPMNRRNPGKVMLGRFPGECCMCGGETRGAQIVQHPSIRGPRGGKKYAHVDCM